MLRRNFFPIALLLCFSSFNAIAGNISTSLSAGWANSENKGGFYFKNTSIFGVTGNFRITEPVDLQLNYYHILSRYSERRDWPRSSFDLDELSASVRVKASLSERLDIFGVAGFGFFHHNFSRGENLEGVVYGLGGEYRISNQVALLLQFRRHADNGYREPAGRWSGILGGLTFYFEPPHRIHLSETDKAKIIFKYLATPSQTSSIKSERELEQAAWGFWQVRREEFEEIYLPRFDYVQENFSGHRTGYKTDPGRIWIILGEPDERFIIPRTTPAITHDYEIWTYWKGWQNIQPAVFVFQEKSAGEFCLTECNIPGEIGYTQKTYRQVIERFESLRLIP